MKLGFCYQCRFAQPTNRFRIECQHPEFQGERDHPKNAMACGLGEKKELLIEVEAK